jgi:hypothetical protein
MRRGFQKRQLVAILLEGPERAKNKVYYLKLRVQDLFKCPYYWGQLKSSEAHEILKNKQNGSFLIRNASHEEESEIGNHWKILAFSYLYNSNFRNFYVIFAKCRLCHGKLVDRMIANQQYQSPMQLNFSRLLLQNAAESKYGLENGILSVNIEDLLKAVNADLRIHGCESEDIEVIQENNNNNNNFLCPIMKHSVCRESAFSLKNLARAVICDSNIFSSEQLANINCPESMKKFLQEYSMEPVKKTS